MSFESSPSLSVDAETVLPTSPSARQQWTAILPFLTSLASCPPTTADNESLPLSELISRLRPFVLSHPHHLRARAGLATALRASGDISSARDVAAEGASMPLRGTQNIYHPCLPILSVVGRDASERASALRRLVDGCEGKTVVPDSEVDWTARLLIESRKSEREGNGEDGDGPYGDDAGRRRRDRPLDDVEERLYQRVVALLGSIDADICGRNDNSNYDDGIYNDTSGKMVQRRRLRLLANVHYSLGKFFRKIRPKDAAMYFDTVVAMIKKNNEIIDDEENAEWMRSMAARSAFFRAALPASALGTTTTAKTIDRCPPEHVRALYRSFAPRFDNLLVEKLHYETPDLVRRAIERAVGSSTRRFDRALDLGCGTGLSGVVVRGAVQFLRGVDLSPEMVDVARKRGIYDDLIVGELERGLPSLEEEDDNYGKYYDLVLACDVFVYLGDLRGIFRAVRKSLTPKKGIFAFSTELLQSEGRDGRRTVKAGAPSDPPSYFLQECARFAHSSSYLKQLANDEGFEVIGELETAVIRVNRGKDVLGTIAVMQPKPSCRN